MDIRREMIEAARRARQLLGESADLVGQFLARQQNEDGGFKDRAGKSDLYYTVFGLDALTALGAPASSPRIEDYLRSFGAGDDLDLVHLCSLVRCWAAIGRSDCEGRADSLVEAIERYRSRDGGYSSRPRSAQGTPYGCYLSLGAYQDLDRTPPNPEGMRHCLAQSRTPDGAWSNSMTGSRVRQGSTLASAAALAVLRNLGDSIDPAVGAWLMARSYPQGGFLAAPRSPIPDLLSTAATLHALASLGIEYGHLREGCIDFLDSLWTSEGGFLGHWADTVPDCEYAFYGLLSAGHLCLPGTAGE